MTSLKQIGLFLNNNSPLIFILGVLGTLLLMIPFTMISTTGHIPIGYIIIIVIPALLGGAIALTFGLREENTFAQKGNGDSQ